MKLHKVINFEPAGFRVKEDGEETACISKHKEWLGHLLESATDLSLKKLKEDFISPPINGKGPDHVSEHALIEDKTGRLIFGTHPFSRRKLSQDS